MAAAEEWADHRLMEEEAALETKVEQALLEIEHLVSGVTSVEFDLDGTTVRYDPTADLGEFLATRATEAGIDEATLLRLYVDLFARVFLERDDEQPPTGPLR